VSTFTFTIEQPANNLPGDGFTYFIQNDAIQDLNGGTGFNLGVYGIARSIAVKFDVCVDRPATCTVQQASLVRTDENQTQTLLATTLIANSSEIFFANLTDGTMHTVTVGYTGRTMGASSYIQVKLDSQELFTGVVGDISTDLFNSRFAWFGFTASTSYSNTAQIDIHSWDVLMQASDTAIHEYSSKPISLPYASTASFTLVFRDSCLDTITKNQTTMPAITATLLQEAPPGTASYDLVILNANISATADGGYLLDFNLPDHYVGNYDLNVVVNGVSAQSMPWIGAIVTFVPPPPGYVFPTWALILLLLLILLIVIVLSYVLYRLHRYRKKLKANELFIEEGKRQAELDKLEDGLSYTANPLVGTVDDLKAQLAKNEEELARLRGRHGVGEDQEFTIQQLQKQRDELAAEMRRLKTEEQEAEVARQAQTHVDAGGRKKKEFGREMAT